MSYIIIEEYEDNELVRITHLKKEEILAIHDIEWLEREAIDAIARLTEESGKLKEKLKELLKKSEYEISNIVGQPVLNAMYKLIDSYLGYKTRLQQGFRIAIDLKDFGKYSKVSIYTLKKALETDKDVRIKVYLKREGNEFKVEKEEIEELS